MKLKLEKFEGPLDLLLQLIETDKLDITEIALAEVAEQYIGYLDAIEVRNPEFIADFLVIASRLLYIKSRVLLPGLGMEREEGGNLAEQLKLYKKYYDASFVIAEILDKKKYLYGRPVIKRPRNIQFELFLRLNSQNLKKIFIEILNSIQPRKKIETHILNNIISIKQKIKQIKDMLFAKKILNFSDVIKEFQSKPEIIVAFLSVLELAKQRYIYIEQLQNFGEMRIFLSQENILAQKEE